ncbi:MAG TPA: alpha-amylase, partial [Flavobacteriales bacterium]|nr:alpha-amylase [Flavobacteriales bacterium]
MKISTDGNSHWLQINNLIPGTYYRYFFLVEGVLEIGDPYSELILDPWNDGYIPQVNFPGMPQYPTGVASVPISTFRTDNPYFL